MIGRIRPCVFYPAGQNGKGLRNLILLEGKIEFKRKITVETVNNITYAQDNGKEATKIPCTFLFFDQQPNVADGERILEELLKNPDADTGEDTSILSYEQAEEFRRLLLLKPSNKYPAYLSHPLFPDKIKVIVSDLQEIVGYSKEVGMAKLNVTFIQVDNYGVVPSKRTSVNNVKGQEVQVVRPVMDNLFGTCRVKLEKNGDIDAITY